MTTSDLTKAEREEVLKWIRSGFRQYAKLCGYWEGKIHRNIRAQVFKYGNEFGRILRGKVELSDEHDPDALRLDFHSLMNSGCPAHALVELMLASTSGFGVTISDLLFRAEILDEHLISHDNLGFPTKARGAFKFGGLKLPRSPGKAHRRVPLSIQFMHEILEKNGQPSSHYGRVTRGFSAGRPLALSYLFLKHFGCGHKTLAQMLTTMQSVRRRVAPLADYLRTGGGDTFSEHALQRRVCRFFKSDPASEQRMEKKIELYLSDEKRQSGKMFLLDP